MVCNLVVCKFRPKSREDCHRMFVPKLEPSCLVKLLLGPVKKDLVVISGIS